MLSSIGRIEDDLTRALCWSALWDATRDGELPARSYVEAVLAGVVVETDPRLVEALLGQAAQAAGSYAPPAEQDALLEVIARQCLSAPVEPGSDLQLVRVRAAVQITTDRDLLRGLLAGDFLPLGLVVDTGLRWHVVRRAAALGMLDEAELERELAGDATASGQLEVEAARVGRPAVDVKTQAWQALVGGDLTNAQARAEGRAFWQREQAELLRPYVERYVDVVRTLWSELSPQLAESLTSSLFPSTLIEQGVHDRIASLLRDSDLPAGLRRIVLEQLDDLWRALAAQQAR